MQQPLSNPPQLDCLSVELTGTPVLDQSDGIEYLDLNLTLHFKQAWQPLIGGRFKFGLTGGTLQLGLENATMPQGLKLLTSLVNIATQGSESVNCQVTTTGTATQPSWTFTLKSGAHVLQGSLGLVNLGRLQFTGTPAKIETIFQVTPANVQLIEAEGLWPHDISPNKHGVLERTLMRALAFSKLQPHLSRVQLRYTSLQESPIVTQDTIEASDEGLEELQDTIERILAANTNDFIELATLAGLNPAEDFAGGKLWGSNLSGVDFSGANLRGVKLRGADLSDADLSEADLTGARLAGADLSGALLSDANLAGADLHRCSLALANLSGANLADANLEEANLSNVNLSDANLSNTNLSGADLHEAGLVLTNLTGADLKGAKVTAARFKKDSGLSEDMERDLKARGAIFEE